MERDRLGGNLLVGPGGGGHHLPVGWSFVAGGVIWWAHTLFGCARTQVCVFISTSGYLVWDFARENGVGIVLWFEVGVRVGSSHFEWFRVVVLSGFESWWYIFVECQLAEGFGRKGFKGVFGSVNGCWASDEKVLCGVLWRGDGRGGVFYHFFHFCVD